MSKIESGTEFEVVTEHPTAALVQLSLREDNTAVVLHDPVFVLAPPRSFSSIVATMLGQHPQMYGLPELELFAAETMAEWWDLCSKATFPRAHGALRAVAQLYFHEQTEETIKLARGWLRRRAHITTGYFLEMLAHKVRPRIVVDKSTSNVYRPKFLQHTFGAFPNARFIHLVRHPRGHGESVMKFLNERVKEGPVPASHWMRRLAAYSDADRSDGTKPGRAQEMDPQCGWYALHMNICRFLESVPVEQKLRVRGEDILKNPNDGLGKIAAWLGLRTDTQAIEEMKHPERSPYACFGPPGARYGNDRFFLENPVLRPARAELQSLDGPLDWRVDGQGFSPEVRRLAEEFGYA
jgi:Sulfotransferase family